MIKSLLQKKWLLIGIILCITMVFSLVFFYCKKIAPIIPTTEVTKGSIVEQSEAVGYIKMRHFSTIKSQVDGIAELIYHDEGEYVTKGTPLIKIKPAPAPHDYAEKHQALANALSDEKETELVFKRYKHLLDNKIIRANNIDYTSAQNKYITAKNNRILAEQKLALLEHGETIVAGKQIANIVVSPVDGYILHRSVNMGDPIISMSSAQSATPLFIVANMQELMFQGSVDERDAAKIKIGMLAKIKIGSLPDQEVTGKISRIALQSDKENKENSNQGNSGSSSSDQNSPFNVGFKVEITELQLPKDLVLRSGYSATADIQIKKVDNILLLPIRVVQYKDTKPFVLLPTKNGKEPKHQPIELGVSDNMNIEIKSGLKFGDKVIDQPDMTTAH